MCGVDITHGAVRIGMEGSSSVGISVIDAEPEMEFALRSETDGLTYSFFATVDVAQPPFNRAQVLTVRPLLVAVNKCSVAVLVRAHEKADPIRLDPNGGRADIHHAREMGITSTMVPTYIEVVVVPLTAQSAWSHKFDIRRDCRQRVTGADGSDFIVDVHSGAGISSRLVEISPTTSADREAMPATRSAATLRMSDGDPTDDLGDAPPITCTLRIVQPGIVLLFKDMCRPGRDVNDHTKWVGPILVPEGATMAGGRRKTMEDYQQEELSGDVATISLLELEFVLDTVASTTDMCLAVRNLSMVDGNQSELLGATQSSINEPWLDPLETDRALLLCKVNGPQPAPALTIVDLFFGEWIRPVRLLIPYRGFGV